MKTGWRWLIVGSLTLLGLSLRIYQLDRIPNGFFFDEATISYQAYSLLTTGKDTWGNVWPLLSFKDYGEYILPVGVYGQMFSFAFGGLTVLAARLPHALLGALTILLVFVVGRQLFGQRVSLLASLLLVFSPLSLGWSRFVFEGNFGTVFFLLGVIYFVKSLKFAKFLPMALSFFGLAMLSYHIFLVTVPLFILGLVFLTRERVARIRGETVILSVLVTLFFIAWAGAAIFSGAGRQRFDQAATLLTAEKLDILNHQIGYCQQKLPATFCRAFLNRYLLALSSYAENYVSHFSPIFLGFDGSFLRRNILPRTGIIQAGEVVTFFVGVYFLVRGKGTGPKLLMLWLAVYPAANSFTGVGEISRIAFAAPLFSLVSAYGLGNLWAVSQKITMLLMLAIFAGTLSFLVSYFSVFPITNAYYTNFGYDKVFRWVRENRGWYDRIFISKNYAGSVPYISALFFLPVDPKAFTSNQAERVADEKGYFLTTRIDNLYFYNDIKRLKLTLRDFVIATPEEVGQEIHPDFTIIDPTGRTLLIGVSADDYLNQEI